MVIEEGDSDKNVRFELLEFDSFRIISFTLFYKILFLTFKIQNMPLYYQGFHFPEYKNYI